MNTYIIAAAATLTAAVVTPPAEAGSLPDPMQPVITKCLGPFGKYTVVTLAPRGKLAVVTLTADDTAYVPYVEHPDRIVVSPIPLKEFGDWTFTIYDNGDGYLTRTMSDRYIHYTCDSFRPTSSTR